MLHVVRRAVAARGELDVVVEARALRPAAQAAGTNEEAAAEGGEAEHDGDDPHRRVLLPRGRLAVDAEQARLVHERPFAGKPARRWRRRRRRGRRRRRRWPGGRAAHALFHAPCHPAARPAARGTAHAHTTCSCSIASKHSILQQLQAQPAAMQPCSACSWSAEPTHPPSPQTACSDHVLGARRSEAAAARSTSCCSSFFPCWSPPGALPLGRFVGSASSIAGSCRRLNFQPCQSSPPSSRS